MMYPVVKLSSTEITNALNASQNICLEVGNDMQELLQRFVKQIRFTQRFVEGKNSIFLFPWEFEIADVHCKNIGEKQ